MVETDGHNDAQRLQRLAEPVTQLKCENGKLLLEVC